MKLVCFTLLYLAVWTCNVYSTHGPMISCCLKVSVTRVRVALIVDYRHQSEDVCRTAAVVFTAQDKQTGKKTTICADPNGNWTKRAIIKVNADRERVLPTETTVAS